MNNSIIVIDEAHGVMNTIHEIYFKVVLSLVKNTKTIFISATPVKNTIVDFIPLYEFLVKEDLPFDRVVMGGKRQTKISELEFSRDKKNLEEIRQKLQDKISYHYNIEQGEESIFFPKI